MKKLTLVALLASATIAHAGSLPGYLEGRKNLSAWHKVVSPSFHSQEWIYNLNGVEVPYSTVTLHGMTYYLGWICKPHDCADNKVAYLLPVRGDNAYGELQAMGSQTMWFGAPDAEARQLLAGQLQ